MQSLRRQAREPADVETIKRVFRYEPEAGLLFWRETVGQRAQAGSVAGRVHSNGYVIVRFRKRSYSVHRIAYAIMKGVWPENEVDHRDRVRSNNRWKNLRAATDAQNAVNVVRSRKYDLPRGAHRIGGRFMAIAHGNGRRHYLGCFGTPEAAAEAYREAASRMHGDFLPT